MHVPGYVIAHHIWVFALTVALAVATAVSAIRAGLERVHAGAGRGVGGEGARELH